MIEKLGNEAIFFIGLGILLIFFWYFATDKEKKKRLIGTILSVLLSVFFFFCFFPPTKYIKLGMDLSGGVRFTLGIETPEGRQLAPDARELAISALNRRLNDLGNSDIRIAAEGEKRIRVDIPNRGKQKINAKQLANIEEALTRQAILNFHLENEMIWKMRGQGASLFNTNELLQKMRNGDEPLPPNSIVLPMSRDGAEKSEEEAFDESKKKSADPLEPLFLAHKYPDVEGKWVSGAFAFWGVEGNQISLNLKGEGAEKFFQLSRDNVRNGRRLAIVLDGVVLSALGFNEAIPGGRCLITGDFSEDESKRLASAMTNPLEAPLTILYKEYFPPQLGKSAIREGLRAGLLGIGLTIVFMIIYYRFAGLVALVGLSVNMILLFGMMAIFRFDFTMPGIAGVLLTLGMAIDANVLIYERLREEINNGKSASAAVRAAYAKAFSAIFDSNITTILTAAILFAIASGAVKGFALTLMIGIIVSLFSALLVTRVCFMWLVDSGAIKKLGFMHLFGRGKFDFLRYRFAAMILSIIFVVLALVALTIKKKDALGVEFVGGDLVRFELPKAKANLTDENIREILQKAELTRSPKIERLSPLGGEKEFISISAGKGSGDKILAILRDDLGINLDDAGVTEISGVVAAETFKSSIWALAIGIIAILIYLSIRFEFAFALGAIVALTHDLIISIGASVVFGIELSLVMVGAFLTIAGYSINDTIVVFDRIRETLRQSKKRSLRDTFNHALNATISRTALTSLTTLLTLLALYVFGGIALKDFSFAIIIGIIVGTYSSIFVASPFVIWYTGRTGEDLRAEVLGEKVDIN